MGRYVRMSGNAVLAGFAFLLASGVLAQNRTAGAGPADPVRALDEQVRRQQDRIRALEAEADFERRRAEAVAGYANRRVADAIADTERRARETAADLAQLRSEYEREVAALQRLFEDASRRADDAERRGWLWGVAALPVGALAGWLARRRRERQRAADGPRSFTPGEFAAFLSRRRPRNRTIA